MDSAAATSCGEDEEDSNYNGDSCHPKSSPGGTLFCPADGSTRVAGSSRGRLLPRSTALTGSLSLATGTGAASLTGGAGASLFGMAGRATSFTLTVRAASLAITTGTRLSLAALTLSLPPFTGAGSTLAVWAVAMVIVLVVKEGIACRGGGKAKKEQPHREKNHYTLHCLPSCHKAIFRRDPMRSLPIHQEEETLTETAFSCLACISSEIRARDSKRARAHVLWRCAQ